MNKLKKFNKILLAVVFILLAGGFFGAPKSYADTATFYPDADPETTSVDGFMRWFGTDTWIGIRGATANFAGGSEIESLLAGVRSDATQWLYMGRAIFLFDTSSIPDNATITSATLSIYSSTDGGTSGNSFTATDWSVNVFTANPASNTALVGADTLTLGTTPLSSSISIASWASGAPAYKDFVLNATGLSNISKTSVTKFGVREATYDAPNVQPTWQADKIVDFRARYADQTGTTTDPKLVVTYTVPAPTITSPTKTSITSTGATLGGNVTSDGGASVTGRGVCVGTSANPAIGGTCFTTTGTTGVFTVAATGLTFNTLYHYRAYATNSQGTSYTIDDTFTTLVSAPSVTTSAATSITSSQGVLNSTINPNGASTNVTYAYGTSNVACGSLPSTLAGPTGLTGTSPLSGASTLATLSSLNPNTTYYFCAYATNSTGTTYGTVLSFTTPAVASTITTPTKTSITSSGATLGGNVTSDGGASVTGRGVCVGTSANPAIGGTCFTTTGTTGVFTVPATGLSSGTLYHYRAYATNSVGTSYTTDDTFTTGAPSAPTVGLSSVTNVDSMSTTPNGTVNPNYLATNAWYMWGPSNAACASLPNSTTVQSLGAGGSSVALAAPLAGFVPGVTYYYCIAAVNSLGIAFSSVSSFVQTSASGCPLVPLNSDYTMPSSCRFGNPISDGVDKGTDTLNVGVLQVPKGQTLTVLNGQVISYGILFRPGATLVINSGGSFRRSNLWLPDTDGDTYPDNPGTQGGVVSDSRPTGYVRRAVVAGNSVDCAPNDNTKFKNYIAYTDADGDGYGNSVQPVLTCLGDSLTAGLSLTSSGVDCNDANASYGATCPSIVTTTAASSITVNSAILNSTVNPNNYSTDVTYRYGTSNVACASLPSTLAGPTGLTGTNNLSGATTRATLSGLTPPNTTYYFCASATSSQGTTYGTVLSFATLADVPSVTTSAATSITSSQGVLNSTINPNGASTNVTYAYGTSNVACGSLPSTLAGPVGLTGTSNLSGASTQATLSSLNPNTTYYFCAYATNSQGTTYGSVLNFTTSAIAPSITAQSSSSLAITSATLNSTVNPNNATTSITYRYSTSNNVCSSLASTLAGPTGLTGLNAISPNATSLTGLTGNTTYYYCSTANNVAGTTNAVNNGNANSAFLTYPGAPTSVTGGSATQTSISVSWTAPTGGAASYDLWRCTGTGCSTFAQITAGVTSPRSDTGLTCNTIYRYRIRANNATGSTDSASSADVATSACAPSVTTSAASSITGTSVILNSTINPNGGSTDVAYKYGTSNVACASLPSTLAGPTGLTGSSPLSGASTQATLSSLVPSTLYYFCAYAVNSGGTTYGSVLSFTTSSIKPSVTAQSATSLAITTASLTSTVNPNNQTSSITYRYSTTNQVCSSHSTTVAGPTGLTGTSAISPNTTGITGLTGNTTYYYCSTANNATGTTNAVTDGNASSNFLTYPGAPTSVTGGSATQTAITVSWTAPTGGAASYDLWRCTGTGCSTFAQITAGFTSGSSNSGLTCGTIYRYRIRANNATGSTDSASSADVSTSACATAPTLNTPTSSSVTYNSAVLGANVASDGGATITARGICWSTGTTAPSLVNGATCVSTSGTTGTYSFTVSSLPASSRVYFQGYATNNASLTGYTTGTNYVDTPAACTNMTVYADTDSDTRGNSGTITSGDAIYTNSSTLNMPLGVQNGTVLIAATVGTSVSSAPSGWTFIRSQYYPPYNYFMTTPYLNLFYRVATGAETTPVSFSGYGSYGIVAAYNGVDIVSPTDGSGGTTVSSDTNSIDTAAFSTTTTNTKIVMATSNSSNGGVRTGAAPSGWSKVMDSNSLMLMDKTLGSTYNPASTYRTYGNFQGAATAGVALRKSTVNTTTQCVTGGVATGAWSVNQNDCNDNSSALYQVLSGYKDRDGDGIVSSTAYSICSGASYLTGYASSPSGTDCDDSSSLNYQNFTGVQDSDNDTYTVGGSVQVCGGASLPSGYRASASGTVDCYDQNANAYPTSGYYGSTNRGDGSFDYNCDGNQSNGGAVGTRVSSYTPCACVETTDVTACGAPTSYCYWEAQGPGINCSGQYVPEVYFALTADSGPIGCN